MPTNDERRFGRDLNLPGTAGGTIAITTTGDLVDVTGRENLNKAQRRRTLTLQGTLVHRPLYGGSLVDDVEELSSPASRSEMGNRIRRNALRDSRIDEASVLVTEGTADDPLDGTTVTVKLGLRVRGEDIEGSTIEIEV